MGGNQITNTIDIKFKYDGFWRRVSNITMEPETRTLIGMEMRKSGKFSYRIKRYNIDKIEDLIFVKPFLRRGPNISIPE
jgi:hypothetical protein